MYNKYRVPKKFSALEQQVYSVFKEVLLSYRSGDITTREELLLEYNKAVNKLNRIVEDSLFEHADVIPDTPPTVQDQNPRMNSVRDDLVLLFKELRQLGNLMVGLYDQIAVENNDLVGRIKRVYSKLGDFSLFTGSTGTLVSESFSESSGLDINSSLLSKEQCYTDYNEGSICLAISDKTPATIKGISVDRQTFTGVVGSNEDLNSLGVHSTLTDITDGNPDSWTEFELTYFTDEEKPNDLFVRLIIELDKLSIVNYFEIDPINFGLLNGAKIEDIEVSADGSTWESIRVDVPLADYLDETESDIFLLSPASSKFTGIFSYNALPRKAKFVAVSIRQDTPYIIQTSQGQKYRLAIGLRGIDLYSVKYVSESEIVSTIRNAGLAIAKVSLLSAYRPALSELGSVEFFVSFDDGGTWLDIQPLIEDDWEQVEVLNIDGSYTSIRFKVVLTRNDSIFSDATSITGEEEIKTGVDTITVNRGINPMSMNPSRKIADADVTVVDAPLGSRGEEADGRPRFRLGIGTGDKTQIRLPFFLFPYSSIHTTDLDVFVDGIAFSLTNNLTGAASDARVFAVSNNGLYVVFGDGDGAGNGNGLSPATGSIIELSLGAEHLFFERNGDGYLAVLDMPTDGNVSTTLLEHSLPPTTYASTRLIPAGEYSVGGVSLTKYQLPIGKIYPGGWSISEFEINGTAPASPVFNLFLFSLSAVNATGEYHIDFANGIIYSFDELPTTEIATFRYRYYSHIEQSDFEIVKAGEELQGIYVPLNSLVTHMMTDTIGGTRSRWGFYEDGILGGAVLQGTKALLSHGSIVRGSVVLEDGFLGTSITPHEVLYVDGTTELHQLIDVEKEEIVPTSTIGLYTFIVSAGADIHPAGGISFSNSTIFVVRDSLLNDIGDWDIDFATGTISVVLPTTGLPSGITMSYVYTLGTTPDLGRYSINHKDGIIYFRSTPVSGKIVTYTMTKYRLNYNVGDALGPSLVEINQEENSVRFETSSLRSSTANVVYHYKTDVASALSELAPYYTPLVRDLRFRLLPSGMVT